ncbi:MAG: hypothetical protein Udaeo2_01190 [Candidatus Udaeobacter sp.]|nr:MAG: hypothetical protein Udaeo2_01190 [Candidatus Udaeobacter sp.]
MLSRNHWGELRQDQLTNRQQVSLALQHARKLCEISFEPVLLLIPQCGVLQVADHFVDVVLHGRNLALRFHLNRTCQITFRDGGSNVGDGSKLRRQIRCEPVYIIGQIAPGPGGPWHTSLSAQFSLDADLSRDSCYLIGKRRERINHVVDCVGQLADFPFCFNKELLVQVSLCNCGDNFRDTTHLVRQIAGHEIHAVGQVLPRAGNTFNRSLSA